MSIPPPPQQQQQPTEETKVPAMSQVRKDRLRVEKLHNLDSEIIDAMNLVSCDDGSTYDRQARENLAEEVSMLLTKRLDVLEGYPCAESIDQARAIDNHKSCAGGCLLALDMWIQEAQTYTSTTTAADDGEVDGTSDAPKINDDG